MTPLQQQKGFTLIEIIVAVGLFSIVMSMAAGAYLLMVGVNQQAKSISTGIDNLAFALESMARTIRTGTAFSCGTSLNLGDCSSSGNSSFSLVDQNGSTVTYSLTPLGSSQYIQKRTVTSATPPVTSTVSLTDATLVNITAMTFALSGATPASGGDVKQPYVVIVVSGTVLGKTQKLFTIETSAAMRGSDI